MTQPRSSAAQPPSAAINRPAPKKLSHTMLGANENFIAVAGGEGGYVSDLYLTQTIYIVLCNCVTATRLIPLRIH